MERGMGLNRGKYRSVRVSQRETQPPVHSTKISVRRNHQYEERRRGGGGEKNQEKRRRPKQLTSGAMMVLGEETYEKGRGAMIG